MKPYRNALPVVILLLSCLSYSLHAAPPPRTFGYQGYLKDSAGRPVTTAANLTFRLYSSPSGINPVWTEPRSVTPVNGVYAVNLGESVSLAITFDRRYFLGIQVGTDPELRPLQPLNAAPYALQAPLPTSSVYSSSASPFDVTNTGTGPAIRGIGSNGNSGILGGDAGVTGTTTNAASGVLGQSSGSGAAVEGFSIGSGPAIFGHTAGTGSAGWFTSTNSSNTSQALYVSQNGKGNALEVVTTGADANAASFTVNNVTNPYNALYAFHKGPGAAIQANTIGNGAAVRGENSGTGMAGSFSVSNAANPSIALSATTVGTGAAGWFTISNPSSGSYALFARTDGSGDALETYVAAGGSGRAVYGHTGGTGSAGVFAINNPASNSTALAATTNGLGKAGSFSITNANSVNPALSVIQSGKGNALDVTTNGADANAASFTVNNAANPYNALYAYHIGPGAVIQGNTAGTGSAGLFSISNNASGASALSATTSGSGSGVYGQTAGTTGAAGVYGLASGATGTASGVYGKANSNTGYGVHGYHNTTGNYGYLGLNTGGAYGYNSSNSSYGILGSIGGGVFGYSPAGAGISGQSSTGNGVQGQTGDRIGVYGINNSANWPAVEGWSQGTGDIFRGWSGPNGSQTLKFYVSNNGTLWAAAKNFRIDHPLDPKNRYLNHVSVESPDMKNIYDGIVTTDDRGYATVELPAWFESLNGEFRYQLTVVDETDGADFVQAKVVKGVTGNRFTLRTSAPGVTVSWQVTGIRKDAWAAANRIQVEVDKPASEKGTCIYPEACR